MLKNKLGLKAILPALALVAMGVSSFATGTVPAEVTAAADNVSATFTSVFTIGVTISVALIGLRLLKRVAK